MSALRRGAGFVLGVAITLAGARPAAAQPTVRLVPGMVITRSVRIAPGTYRFPAPDALDTSLVTVRGSDLTLDLRGVTIEGLAPGSDPDRAVGVALRIAGGHDVTVRGGTIRGYRVAVLARDVRHLALAEMDLSHNWKPRLWSGIEHESLVDWLSYHKNEGDEWLRYGAAVYLAGVRGGALSALRIEQGMNGVLMTRSDSVAITGSRIRYNSGVGVGLYRSSDNLVTGNRLDYNVRGFSLGFYRRGQDSAGLLIFEQSCRNVVAFNSISHGGDGVFLWAGQQTMDTGAGGANDNLIFQNDASYAATNGIEVTFSRNAIVGNNLAGNDHGIWGGYSWETLIAGNWFADNRIAIAIEHGQDNVIAANTFERDTTALRLWWNRLEPSDWGYPRHRDTRSRDVLLVDNEAIGVRTWARVSDTQRFVARGNRVAAETLLVVAGDTSGFAHAAAPPATALARDNRAAYDDPAREALAALRTIADGTDARLAAQARRALGQLAHLPRMTVTPPMDPPFVGTRQRELGTLIVDEWGPYDWRSPKLWPVGSPEARPLPLRLVGPRGRWRVTGRRGIAALSADSGGVPDTLRVTPDSTGPWEDWEVTLTYVGEATVSPRGEHRAAGAPVPVRYGVRRPRTTWRQRIVTWGDSTMKAADTLAIARALAGPPALERATPTLDYEWFRPKVAGIPLARWALEAEATLEVPPGAWELTIISDDGVRAWVDDRLVLDAWAPHESRVDRAPLPPGRHRVRVQYYQVDGWTELDVRVLAVPPTP